MVRYDGYAGAMSVRLRGLRYEGCVNFFSFMIYNSGSRQYPEQVVKEVELYLPFYDHHIPYCDLVRLLFHVHSIIPCCKSLIHVLLALLCQITLLPVVCIKI